VCICVSGVYLIARCNSRRSLKLILLNIANKIVHFNIHTDFSSGWSSKADFSTLRWFMTVLLWAKHALIPNLKRFRLIDNEQYNSYTDPCTVQVRILYHHHLNVSWNFDYHVDFQIHKRNHLNLFFSSYLSIESQSMLPNFSLAMEFWGIVFTYFSFEKLLSHEALVTGRVTATSDNQTQLFQQL